MNHLLSFSLIGGLLLLTACSKEVTAPRNTASVGLATRHFDREPGGGDPIADEPRVHAYFGDERPSSAGASLFEMAHREGGAVNHLVAGSHFGVNWLDPSVMTPYGVGPHVRIHIRNYTPTDFAEFTNVRLDMQPLSGQQQPIALLFDLPGNADELVLDVSNTQLGEWLYSDVASVSALGLTGHGALHLEIVLEIIS